jgi:hypothetical protein
VETSPHRPWSRLRRWAVWGVAIVVVSAAVGVVAYQYVSSRAQSSRAQGPSGPTSSAGNGLTFLQAYDPVNASVQTLPGGPWRVTSIVGVAPETPAAPLPNFPISLNQTLRLCQRLPGVTVWNSTGVPVFTGTLNSGAAPFWSFIFKNGAGEYAYATDLNGALQIDPPSATFTSCLKSAGIGSSYFVNVSTNTPDASELAYVSYGENFTAEHAPVVEYYVLGNAQFVDPDASPLGWIVDYFQCDQVNVSGIQDYLAVGNLVNGNVSGTVVDNGWLSCTVPAYMLDFGSPAINQSLSGSGGQYLSVPFQVVMPPSGEFNGSYDGWGVLAWMTQLGIAASGGVELPASAASCQHWVANVSECGSDASGWFAVLLSQNGEWLDSYPSETNSSAWSIPNVIMSSQDQLVVVAPPSWNLTGDSLDVTGVSSGPAMNGSLTL